MIFGIDPLYIKIMLPALILAGLASLLTKSTFSKYSKLRASSGLTGAQAARKLLSMQGVGNVTIEQVDGFLSDHYDPRSLTLRLSPDVYSSPSLSAIGVACHEAGHALQHATSYAPLTFRSALVPVAQFGSYGSYIFIMLGAFTGILGLAKIGIVLFSVTVLFSLITLPVEWNASMRAKKLMVSAGIVTSSEQKASSAVLNAAFMTYIAAALTALLMLIYHLLRSGLLGGRKD